MDAASSRPRPTVEHYRLLRRLRRLVLRSNDATLTFLWGDDPRSLDWLRAGLDDALRARSRRVSYLPWSVPETFGPTAEDPAAAIRSALTVLLEPPPAVAGFAVWVDLGRSSRPEKLRDHLLARLNERRAQLLRFDRAVLVSGPVAAEGRAGEIAPDLWSMRTASLQVPAWPVEGRETGPSAPLVVVPVGAPPAYTPLWREAWARHQAQREAGVADAAIDPWLGWSAAGEALRHGRFAEAKAILSQTRQTVGETASAETDAALRRAAVQALNEGDLFAAQRRWQEAGDRYDDARSVFERLVRLTAESPGALRDWSVSLEKVGDIRLALGDLQAARERYEEGLEVRERLVRLTAESPEALRDVAIAWQNLGMLAWDDADIDEARRCFEHDLRAAQRALQQSLLDASIREVVNFAEAQLARLPVATA